MNTFNIQLHQVLDDGDTALREEHRNVAERDVQAIIAEYAQRAMSHSYVCSYTAVVERAD